MQAFFSDVTSRQSPEDVNARTQSAFEGVIRELPFSKTTVAHRRDLLSIDDALALPKALPVGRRGSTCMRTQIRGGFKHLALQREKLYDVGL